MVSYQEQELHHEYYNRRLSQSIHRLTLPSTLNVTTSQLAHELLSSSDPLSSRLVHLAHRLSESSLPPESQRSIASSIFTLVPPEFIQKCRHLFESSLELRRHCWEDGLDPHNATSNDEELFRSLTALGWIHDQLLPFFRSSLHLITMRVIQSLIGADFESLGLLHRCTEWKDHVLIPFCKLAMGTNYSLDRWGDQLQYTVYECFVHVRMGELFELVTEYPESMPAVHELGEALDGTGRLFYHLMAARWKEAMIQRLTHPGAQTMQIIDVYISTIRVLLELDPSGELLQVVSGPVREYLRGRNDTVRCIITSLTEDEGGGDLYEELRRQDAKPLEEAELDEDDEEEMPTFDWQPSPSILHRRGMISGQVGRVAPSSRRAGDILSMLVGIYGSKELFVNEYQIMLADKLLSNLEYDTDKEVHNVELLKLRFGEESMRQCEVMIKDIDDSKRIHTNICSTLQSKPDLFDDPPVVDAAIVSHIFWPTLQKEELKHHPRIDSKLDEFGIEYAKLKNPRRLVWMKQLGQVELEVEVHETDEDGILTTHVKEIKCSPAHATLLSHFEDKSLWTVEELSIETEMPEDMVRKRMGLWIDKRVIQASRSGSDLIYSLVSVHDAPVNEQILFDHEDDDEEHAVSLGAHEEEEMKVYKSFIVGMLSNLGQLPLERIHTMLKTFVAGSDHRYDKTPQQLAVFLQQLCKEETLECSSDGFYKLLKNRS